MSMSQATQETDEALDQESIRRHEHAFRRHVHVDVCSLDPMLRDDAKPRTNERAHWFVWDPNWTWNSTVM